ncbi:hypothetical protein ACX3O0_06960 [Homoserinimonas sp. A447]
MNEEFRRAASASSPHLELFQKRGHWGATLDRPPITCDASSRDAVLIDLINALREYAQDWSRISSTPSHAGNGDIVALVEDSTDEELLGWVLAGERERGYDDLSDGEQAAVRKNWQKQLESRRADLNLEAGLIMEGRSWTEADAQGRIVIQSAEGRLITARAAASWVRASLEVGKVEPADRVITEAVSRIVMSHGEIPDKAVAEPSTTGDRRYDVLIATAFCFALVTRGVEPLPWMTSPLALSEEWLWGGDGGETPELVEYVRERTPALFLAKGILLRKRDLIAP